MESPSKPIRQYSFALSLSLDRVSSGTLMKHFELNIHRCPIDGTSLKTLYGVMLLWRMLEGYVRATPEYCGPHTDYQEGI